MPIRAESARGPMERPQASHMHLEPQALAVEKKWTAQEEVVGGDDEVVMIFMPRSSWEQARDLARRCRITDAEILGFALKHLLEDLEGKK